MALGSALVASHTQGLNENFLNSSPTSSIIRIKLRVAFMSFNELCHTLPDIHISISIQFSLNPLTNNKNIGSALLGVQR